MNTPPQDRHHLAIVGAGLIAEQVHLPRLVTRADTEVVVVVDPDLAKAERVARAFNIPRWARDIESVLNDDSIDVLDLCTPPTMHARQVHAALAANKNVLLEKPAAATLADAIDVAQACAGSERTVMVAENWVFSSAARSLRALLDDGVLGEAFLWTSRHESDHRLASGGQPKWNYSLEASGGGYLTQAGTHAITLGRHLFGEIESVSATSPQTIGTGEAFLDHDMVALLTFRSGVRGSLVLTGRSQRKAQRLLGQSVFGTAGTADTDILTGEVFVNSKPLPGPLTRSVGYDEEFDHFFECLRTGAEPIVSVKDQVETLRAVAAIYRAAATGKQIDVESIA